MSVPTRLLMKVLQVAELVMGRVISCRMLTKGADSSTREEMFLPQPVITELNCLKSSPALGRQIGMCTLKEQMAIVRVRRTIQG